MVLFQSGKITLKMKPSYREFCLLIFCCQISGLTQQLDPTTKNWTRTKMVSTVCWFFVLKRGRTRLRGVSHRYLSDAGQFLLRWGSPGANRHRAGGGGACDLRGKWWKMVFLHQKKNKLPELSGEWCWNTNLESQLVYSRYFMDMHEINQYKSKELFRCIKISMSNCKGNRSPMFVHSLSGWVLGILQHVWGQVLWCSQKFHPKKTWPFFKRNIAGQAI